MNYQAVNKRGDLAAVTITTGTVIPVAYDLVTPANTGVSLAVGTYYFPFGSDLSPMPVETCILSLTARWALAVAATITIEATNFPLLHDQWGGSQVEVSDYDATVGNWMQIDPTLSGTTWAAAYGSSNTMTKFTAVAGAAALGGAMWNIPLFGFKRFRAKVVTTVGGIVRVTAHGKLGA